MLKNVLNRQINLGRISLILLFAAGLVFAGTYNGFVVESEAQVSCCGSTDAPTAETSCCGSGTEVSKLSNAAVGDCDCIPAPERDCSYCETDGACDDNGNQTNSCHADCKQKGSCAECDPDCRKAGDRCGSDNNCTPDDWEGRSS